ncbi:DUF222 domain-containing protein [Georgenia alba]|uniref:DUF222 domain-containing protein n=1 Tax=Georgenia alba TaxID=2233858 RepID=A0ABW2QFP9_9MICO
MVQHPVLAELVAAEEAVARAASVDLHDLPGELQVDVLKRVERLRRRTESLTARALATVEADGRWAVEGARSFAAWWRHHSGRNRATAYREVHQARGLRDHLPATAAALAAGEITGDHAAAMARHATDSPARLARLDDEHVGEDFLVSQARKVDAARFAVLVRHWALRADPEASDRTYVEDSDREEFYLSETIDGYVPGGLLSHATGKTLLTALQARIGTPAADDRRTPAQRRAKALAGLAHLALDSGTLRPGARIRPHLAVTVPFDTLERLAEASAPAHTPGCPVGADAPSDEGAAFCSCVSARPGTAIPGGLDSTALTGAEPATFDDGTPVAPVLLARLACSSHLHRVVFGPDSGVLDVGREERLFTAAQTRAIVARDRQCRFPGCDAPPGEGEIHHSLWWAAHHGDTAVALGILLCWYHHDWVHTREITISRDAGRWRFYRRDGTEILDTALIA